MLLYCLSASFSVYMFVDRYNTKREVKTAQCYTTAESSRMSIFSPSVWTRQIRARMGVSWWVRGEE